MANSAPASLARWLFRAGFVTVLTACTVVEREPVVPKGAQAAPATEQINDDDLRAAVRREIEHGFGVAAPDIDVAVRNGVVVLTGRVDGGLLALQAIRAAETVRGARALVNSIRVEAPTLPDERLAEHVRAALLADSVAPARLRVLVRAGQVRLEGTVESIREREDTGWLAWSVRGVSELVNALEVRPLRIRADVDIAEDVERRLALDALLTHPPPRVVVRDGVIALIGDVGSLYERRRARESAWVTGARAVDDSRMSVDPARRERVRRHERAPSDTEIAALVRDALRLDPRLQDARLSVDVERNVVRLSGLVASWPSRVAAESGAGRVRGVWNVENLVGVRPAVTRSDAELRELVGERLQNLAVSTKGLDLSVVEGRVRLQGDVDAAYESAALERAAGAVSGVVGVENELNVATRHEAPKDDAMLKREIEQALRWDARVDAAAVEVQVRDGVAIVSGAVNGRQEYESVIENVRQMSPRAIESRLRLRESSER